MKPQPESNETPPLGKFSYKSLFSSPAPESVIRWRMDSSDALRSVQASFLGLEWNGKCFVKSDSPNRLCNEKGTQYALTFLSTMVNKVTFQGNVSEDMVRDSVLFFSSPIIETAVRKYREWELDRELISTYVSILLGLLFFSLTRPINDREREHAVGTAREHIETSQTMIGNRMQNTRGEWVS